MEIKIEDKNKGNLTQKKDEKFFFQTTGTLKNIKENSSCQRKMIPDGSTGLEED